MDTEYLVRITAEFDPERPFCVYHGDKPILSMPTSSMAYDALEAIIEAHKRGNTEAVNKVINGHDSAVDLGSPPGPGCPMGMDTPQPEDYETTAPKAPAGQIRTEREIPPPPPAPAVRVLTEGKTLSSGCIGKSLDNGWTPSHYGTAKKDTPLISPFWKLMLFITAASTGLIAALSTIDWSLIWRMTGL